MNTLKVPKYKTRRLASFTDNKGRRIKAKIGTLDGIVTFSRGNRVICQVSMAQLYILASAPDEFRSALQWGESTAADIAEAMLHLEDATRDVGAASEKVLSKTRDASAAFLQAYQCVLPFQGEIRTKTPTYERP